VFLLAHASGASARAPSFQDMLLRWIAELGVALAVNPDLLDDADPQAIEVTFHALLERMAAKRRVVVLVDALDLQSWSDACAGQVSQPPVCKQPLFAVHP